MRTDNTFKRRTAAKFAGLIVIALCFALTFTLTLTLNPVGLSGIANAGIETGGGDDNSSAYASYGSASSQINAAGLTATNFNFPGSGTTTSWSATESFKFTPSATNHQVTRTKADKVRVFSDIGRANAFYVGTQNSVSENKFRMVVNVDLGNFLNTIALNSNMTLTVYASLNLAISDKGGWLSNDCKNVYYFGAVATSETLSGTQTYESTYANSYAKETISINDNGVDKGSKNTNTATLTKDKQNLALVFGCDFEGRAVTSVGTGGREVSIVVSNIQFHYSISYNGAADNANTVINDGSAPVKVAESLMGKGSTWSDTNGSAKVGTRVVEQYSPFVANVANMPVYYSAIASQLAGYTDKRTNLANTPTNAVLNSYVSTALAVPGATANQYRKSAKIEFADTYNYAGIGKSEPFDASKASSAYLNNAGIAGYTVSGSNWIVDTDPTRKSKVENVASGIKSVEMTVVPGGNFQGEATYTFNMYLSNGTRWQRITVDGKYVGYAHVTKNSRANVTVEMYLNVNATVTVTVRDYGGSYNDNGTFEPNAGCTSTTEFRGVDYTAPLAANCNGETKLENDGYVNGFAGASTLDTKYWYKRDMFESEASSGEDKDDEGAPHIWFYTVKKADTFDDLKALTPHSFANYAAIKSKGMLPIGYGSLNSFSYNFAEGCAVVNGVGSSQYTVNNISDIGTQKGVGYYMFTFYKCDIAGNLGEVVSQYVRTDYIQPEYSLDFSYTLPGESEPVRIENLYASVDMMQWALGEATLKLSLPNVNFSGNTLRFEDADGEYIITLDRKGNISLFTSRGKVEPVDGRLELTISTYLEKTKIYFEYSVNQKEENGEVTWEGVLTVTFEDNNNADNRFPTVAWMTGFNLYTVAYADMNEADNDDSTLMSVSKPEARIFIDRHDPSTPELQDEDNGYITKNNEYILDLLNKVWKTDNYLLDATLLFEDYAADIDLFAPYVKVFTGFKFINSAEDFAALKGLVEGSYKNFKTAADATASGLLDKCTITDMSQLSNGSSAYPIEFFSGKGSGMRVIYTWVVDQAGRISDLYSCYVLIDTTNYVVSSDMIDAVIGDKSFGKHGTIAHTDEAGQSTSSFKRGQTVSFTVKLDEGYVPYVFGKSGAGSELINLLINKTPNKTMIKADSAFDSFVTFEEGDADDTYIITFTIDDNDVLSALNSAISFGMSARKVLQKTPGYNKYYDARQLNMREHVILSGKDGNSDTAALEYLEFEYFTSYDHAAGDGNRLEDAPIDVGTYYIRIFIPEDNAVFVMELNENEIVTGKIIPIQFTILKGRVIITPEATSSMYGDRIELSANISGFDFKGGAAPTGEHLVGSLKLAINNWNPANSMVDVGEYRITYDDQFRILDANNQQSGNFDIVFTENILHTITQRRVAVSVWDESKQYGDIDPIIRFAVDSAQFDWYSGGIEALLYTIFGNNYKQTDNLDGVYLYDSNGRITRSKGENAGSYTYIAPSAGAFDVNGNYTIALTIGSESRFIIEKRNVTLDAKGQSTVIKYGQTPDISSVRIDYSLASKDVKFADEIASAVEGLIILRGDGTLIPMTSGGYSGRYVYDIILGNPDDGNILVTDNMIITLATDKYTVYVSEQGTIIIKVKDGAVFEFVYGDKLTANLMSYQSLKDKFEIVTEDGETVDFDDVRWDFNFGSVELNSYIPVGSHYVNIFDAALYKNNALVNDKVIVDRFTATVNPAEIVVRPTSEKLQKTYGQEDGIFNFGFAIVSVNGKPFGTGSSYAGLSYVELARRISGVYARGRYAANGALRYIGERYDDATDANGVILAGAAGDYYSYTVSSAFTFTEGNNFVISAELASDVRFVINPSVVSLDVNRFVGVNKAYDGTNSVFFGSTIAYDITEQLTRATDNVRLAFNAEYDVTGSMGVSTDAGIIFSYLRLEGNAAHNYKLGRITNVNLENKLYDGENLSSNALITDNVRVIIYYIDNVNNTNHIYISMGAIAILKSDFTVSKVYDGTDRLLKSDVSIANRTDEYGGSAMLNQIWGQANSSISNEPRFQGSDAGDYVLNIVMRFDIPGIKSSDIKITNDGAYYDPDITITVIEGVAISVRINSIPATINKKVFGVNSFDEIKPVEQDYSGQSGQGVIKETEVRLKDGQIVDGDVVDVNLVSVISDGNYNAGKHSVRFAEMGDGQNATSSVSNSNYTIDVNALNEFYSNDNALKVTINKAKLKPNIKFEDKDYDGTTEVQTREMNSDMKTDFITASFAKELKSELEKLHLAGTVSYVLSANGRPNPNVATDKDGNVIAHNVLVSGVYINADDESLLANYDMLGGRFNEETGEYDAVAAKSGIVDEYEIIGALTVNRKTLRLLSNNVIIKDKVYDSTREADITISLENSGVVNVNGLNEADYLRVTATGMFAKNTVSQNIPVSISDVRLAASEKYEYLLNNYSLPAFSERRNASILPRPVAVTVDLGEKTYNGTTNVSNNAMKFSWGDMIGNEADGYAVQAVPGNSHFIDKNVNVLKNENGEFLGVGAKEGTVYNPMLRNNRGMVNYELVIAKSEKDGEDYIAYVDANGALHYGEKYTGTGDVLYYYPLPATDKYIEINDENATDIEAARNAGAIAGSYVLNGVKVYAIDSAYGGTVTGNMTAMTYLKGEGKINQKAVSISADGIKIINESVFTKMYDGTTHFLGEENKDYEYLDGGITGVVEGDDVRITSVSAEFDTAYTTANYVLFTPSGITGDDVDNYRIDGKIGFARIRGHITKRTIDAELKDGTVEYGTAVNTIVGEIEYKAHGNVTDENPTGTYDLIEWEKDLYLQLSQYTGMMGFELGNYQDALMSRIYTINKDGDKLNGFDKVVGDVLGDDKSIYYIKLSGITALPSAIANFALSNPQAGQTTLSYTLANVNVNNYAFNPVYQGDGTSKLTVVKRDIFVTARGEGYTKYYAGNDPAVELFFFNAQGQHGLAPGETANIVFKKNGIDYSPVVKWGVFNKLTGEWTEAGKYAVISDDLGENKEYVARFFAPEGVDYNVVTPNYNVLLGESIIYVQDGDLIQMTYGEGYGYKSSASVLELVQPGMVGVSLSDPSKTEFSYTYNGKNQVSKTVNGASSADTITLGDYSEVVNFGTYKGRVNVRREIRIDEHDPNTYFNIWTSDKDITINILKASPQLKAVSTSKYYDGASFEYKVSGADNMISYLSGVGISIRDGYADISYQMLNAKNEYEPVSEMRGAGTYRVVVALNDKFAENNPNYAAESAIATYTILKSVVTVTISSEGYTEGAPNSDGKTLVAPFDGSKDKYEIKYSISNMADAPESIHLPISQTEVNFKSDIVSAGRYPFEVVIKEGEFDMHNYRLVGSKGVLELTTKSVSSSNASVSLDTEAVVNTLVSKEITKSSSGGSDIDLWNSIDSHMPLIDKNATLASVVRLELYCNNTYVEYSDGNIDVKVNIPSSVGDLNGKAIYTVNKNGGLSRLENYTVNNGKIEYTTEYLGALVFIDLTPATMPVWQIALIAVAAVLVAIAAVWTIVAFAVRKSRLKKIA